MVQMEELLDVGITVLCFVDGGHPAFQREKEKLMRHKM
jgi:hypothetical protein